MISEDVKATCLGDDLGICSRQNDALKPVNMLPYKAKKNFADVMKYLEIGKLSGYLGGPNVITRILMRDAGKPEKEQMMWPWKQRSVM